MIPVRKLVSSVCTAVKELGESKGTSVKDITAYIRDIIHGKNVSAISVKKAIKAALQNQLLKETKLGKLKLNANPKAAPMNTMDRLTDEFEILMGRCGKRRRPMCKGRNSKRPRKTKCRRGCTKVWVPRRRRGCRTKKRSCPKRRRRSACPRRRRRNACPKRRRRSCPRRKRRTCCPRKQRKASCPKRRRRTCIRRCEDPAAQLGYQESQGVNVPNEEINTQANNQ